MATGNASVSTKEQLSETGGKDAMASMRQPLSATLQKFTNVVHGWQSRWFVLEPAAGELRYFLKQEHERAGRSARGSLALSGAVVAPSDDDSLAFTVASTHGDAFKLKAADTKQRQDWIDHLRTTAEDVREKEQRRALVGLRDAPPPPDAVRRGTAAEGALVSQVQRTITCAAEQQRALCRAVDRLPSTDSLSNHALLIKATSRSMLDNLNQCHMILRQCSVDDKQSVAWSVVKRSHKKTASSGSRGRLSRGASIRSSASENDGPAVEVALDALSTVPLDEPAPDEEVPDDGHFVDPPLERTFDDHKAVVLTVLSQMKLGTDVTRVPLPTFVLQSRSFLECLSDFFANSRLLLAIGQEPTPEARMLQATKWYLSSFAAGCRAASVRKPFNPVLGELFRCRWRVDGDDGASDVVFVAEQVSHHPPVSALYASCPRHNIHVEAYVWPKSKFMLADVIASIAGGGRIFIGGQGNRRAEVYSFNYPMAYGRAVFTSPFFELGGKVRIFCEQTGVAANIVFETKSLFDNRLHRVTADIRRATGESFCKISGDWTKALDVSFAEMGRAPETLPTAPRQWRATRLIRPAAKQHPCESRRFWADVTEALRAGDVALATERRRLLEDARRRLCLSDKCVIRSRFFRATDDGAWTAARFPNSL